MRGKMKKAMILGAGSLALLLAGPAVAADAPVTKAPKVAAAPPTPDWDIAVTAAVMSDYNFRGITQSNHGASGTAALEFQYNKIPAGQLYAGIQAWAINFPLNKGFTDPSAEIDLYGGWRNTWGKFGLDFGGIYYWYPKEQSNGTISDTDFWEVYGKATYAVTDKFSVGSAVWYTPDLLNTGVRGTYANLTAKYVLPDLNPKGLGWFVSGELGHWWLGTTKPIFVPAGMPDYNYWNLGLGLTYKSLTLDLRYHDTSLSKGQCVHMVLSPTASNYCDARFIATLSYSGNVNAK
jgi:uncharacterized protein (TIGR02001 family)